jgi:hypothetical protein
MSSYPGDEYWAMQQPMRCEAPPAQRASAPVGTSEGIRELHRLFDAAIRHENGVTSLCDGPTCRVCALVLREAASLSPQPTMWCETCRDLHGPSGPHVGEIIPPEKAELLREIDRQHAIELDASLSPQPVPDAFSSLLSEGSPFREKGWDGYGAPPLDPEMVEAARRFLSCVSVVPCVSGGVQLEWHMLGADLEIEFAPGEPVFFYLSNAEGDGALSVRV